MTLHLITNCSATQSMSPAEGCVGAALPEELDMNGAGDAWAENVKAHDPVITPAKLYRGIAFNSVSKARQHVDPENIHIASIGQGFVGLTQEIVPYDLSIDPNHPHALQRVVTLEPFSPTYWWSLVNQKLYGTSTPITDLVGRLAGSDENMLLVALSGRFLSMIVEDLVTAIAEYPDFNLRVISTATSTVIPHQLQAYILRYDRRLNKNMIGNRNDLTQRAALHLFGLFDSGVPVDDILAQQEAITVALDKIAPPSSGAGRKQFIEEKVQAVADIIQKAAEKNPKLLEMDPDRVQAQMNVDATTAQFRRAFRKVRGPRAPLKKISDDATSAAMNALKGIQDRLAAPKVMGASWGEEEKALDALQVFVDLIRQTQPDTKFTSTEAWAWAEAYFKELDEPLPSTLKSVSKTAHLLKNYHADIGLALLTTAQTGGQIFMLASPEDDIDWDDDDE